MAVGWATPRGTSRPGWTCRSRARPLCARFSVRAQGWARALRVEEDERAALGHGAAESHQARFLLGREVHLATIEQDPPNLVAGDHRASFGVGGRRKEAILGYSALGMIRNPVHRMTPGH